jgi:IclR family acetate operon transcriptional repressor
MEQEAVVGRLERRTADPTRGPRTAASVQSVERTLDLFQLLVDAEGEMGMRDMSERTRLPVATVHRLLNVLVKRGYARRNAVARRYGLGTTAMELASHIQTHTGVWERAQPYLQQLVLLTNESANLGVLEGSQAVYLAQAEAPRVMRLFTQVGNRVAFHACAVGKALAAFQTDQEREATLLLSPLTRYTRATITSREKLRVELATIRQQGYAVDEGEFEEAVHCVAVPVLDSRGRALAALSVSGPSGRVTRDRLDAWIPRMKSIARDVWYALAPGLT